MVSHLEQTWVIKDLFIVSSTASIFFIFGWGFFQVFLFKDYELQDRIPVILFSSSFALSCSLFELIIFEILGVMDPTSRLWNWKVSLFLMLSLLILVYPFYMFYLFLEPICKTNKKALLGGTLLLELCFLYFFWKIGDPFPLLTEQGHWMTLEMGIARIGIVGVTVLSCLSGFGAVEYPIQNMFYFMAPVSVNQLRASEKHLLFNTDKVVSKKKQLYLLKHDKGSGSTGKGLHSQIATLNDEISRLERENVELFEDYNQLIIGKKRNDLSQSLKGQFFNLVGLVLSGYCCYKIFMSTINILFDRVSKKDPITNVLEIALKWSNISIDVPFWSQHISFIMIGWMIASSIRGFLTKLLSLFHHWSSTNTSNYIAIAFGQLMGMYFLSSILLLRMNLPAEYRQILTVVLGEMRFDFFHRWSDFIFIPSALFYFLWFSFVWRKKRRAGINSYERQSS